MDKFDKIAGYEKEKEQLKGLRHLLLHLDEFKENGIRIPRGVLLYGAPGVGKTVMAKALAVEPLNTVELCAANCATDEAAEYVVSAFKEAREKAPCVLLIDEIDKICEGSSRFYMEGNDRVMKTLLQELDGQKDNSGVLVVATCNNFRYMNPAILRSGRFDRIFEIGNPSLEDRKAIIGYYLSKVKMAKSIDQDYFAKITTGYVGAQLECVVNEAGIIALEKKDTIINIDHIRTAMNRIAFRSLEGDVGKRKDLQVVATHEAGHALVALMLNPDKLTAATVIPQGSSRGHVRMNRHEEGENISVEDMEKNIAILLAGSVAEKIVFNTNYLSSSSDFQKAYDLTNELITQYGAYGYEYLTKEKESSLDLPLVSAKTIEKIEQKRTEVLNRLSDTARDILTSNSEAFHMIADALTDRYSLTKEEISDIYTSALQKPEGEIA